MHPLALVRRQFRDALVGQEALHEVLVRVWNQIMQVALPECRLRLAVVLDRDDDIDPIGPVAHPLVDPGEFHLQLLGREGRGAQHAEAAGFRHFGHHVATVRKGKNRAFKPQPVF